MKITNFGSCCIDNVYAVPYFVKPGETLPCTHYQVHAGGKGLNQSLALAYAGAPVRHAGKVGSDGVWMKDLMSRAGIDTSFVQVVDTPSGHANIQVTPAGDNAIVIYGGANRTIEARDIDMVLEDAEPGDFLLIQNEISCLEELIHAAHAKQQRIVFNAAPFTAEIADYPLDKIEIFIVNELEGAALAGTANVAEIVTAMKRRFPAARTILTLGERGAVYHDGEAHVSQPAYPVDAVDTTGAGDTFTGYFVAAFVQGLSIDACLDAACRAAAICVTRPGAASSIPRARELDQAL